MDPRFDVELVAVTKRYGTTVAVDAISLRIPKAGYCCLLGPSGCGKTSTLRMIAGHEDITDGDLIIDGRNVTNLPPTAPMRGSDPTVATQVRPGRLHRAVHEQHGSYANTVWRTNHVELRLRIARTVAPRTKSLIWRVSSVEPASKGISSLAPS